MGGNAGNVHGGEIDAQTELKLASLTFGTVQAKAGNPGAPGAGGAAGIAVPIAAMGGQNTNSDPCCTDAASGNLGDDGHEGLTRIQGAKGRVDGQDTSGPTGIGSALSIKTDKLDKATKGKSYSASLALSKPASVTWAAFGLPPGITVAAHTGELTGKPTATGTFTVVVLASSAHADGSKTLSLQVAK